MSGALTEGGKVVLAVESGQWESTESWGRRLRELRKRGLPPSELAEQRGWNPKLVNVLDALPTKHQTVASALLRGPCPMPRARPRVRRCASSARLGITPSPPKPSSGCTTTGNG